jgi:hypothetical protein
LVTHQKNGDGSIPSLGIIYGNEMRPKDTPHLITQEDSLMFDELWSEIQDAPGEIFDIPEMQELNEEYPDDEETWNAFLNSKWDF